MAGRVLRSSNGRFNGSTRGFRAGLKKPSTSRFSSARTDVYLTRTKHALPGKGRYTLTARKITKGERLFQTTALTVGSLSGPVVGGAIGGAIGANIAHQRKTSKNQIVVASGMKLRPALRAARQTRKIDRAVYKNKRQQAKATRKGRAMTSSIG